MALCRQQVLLLQQMRVAARMWLQVECNQHRGSSSSRCVHLKDSSAAKPSLSLMLPRRTACLGQACEQLEMATLLLWQVTQRAALQARRSQFPTPEV